MKDIRHTLRLSMVAFFFVVLLAVLFWRMYTLTVLERSFLLEQGQARSLRLVNMPAYRGMIIDREGAPLAISTPVQSLWVQPKLFHPDKLQLAALSQALQLPERHILKRVSEADDKEFVYLKRQLTPARAHKIASLKMSGVYFEEEFKRYYPQGESAAPLIGFTNVDDKGIEGIELTYQSWLMGINGKKRVLKDRLGRVIEALDVVKPPRAGHDLQLSVDRRIQYFAYHELQDTIEKFKAKSGSVVVLDTKTGEVLAIANAPSFNPNARVQYTPELYRNKAVTDLFEPGSVIKPFSIASALESGHFTPDSVIDTRPSWMVVHGQTIRDIRNYGVLDVTEVLQHSSNVGVSKMVLTSPPEQLIDLLTHAGVGQRTGIGLPGESEGLLVKVKDANPFVLATLGFGYGLSMTALQLAHSYLIFANEGSLIPVRLLHDAQPIQRTQVIRPQTARQVLAMMEAVVNVDGTGRHAKVSGYRVAGKTGTARIAGKHGYEVDRHVASFVGIAPASQPRLIVAVVIHEPTRVSYYGGRVAAPLFSNVMTAALRTLNIQPDQT